jgi:2-dehydro-3-deoxyphosphogluconate aldolase/(4S)-4-hydroxy-2-oxoglutarate aldolase
MSRSEAVEPILHIAPVIPVLVIEDLATAVPIARALVNGGLPVIEITLRSGEALDAITAVSAEVEGAIVGAGTVLSKGQLISSEKAGARFAVSPGVSPHLIYAAQDSGIPFLPGAATASEAMTLMDHGYPIQKFFPAVPAGGLDYLRALAGPLPAIQFCPTGGVNAASAAEYLALPNVICVGGSWLAPPDAVARHDWAHIESLARQAAALRRPQ